MDRLQFMDIKNLLVLGLKLEREFTGKNNAVRVAVYGAKPKKINQFFSVKKPVCKFRTAPFFKPERAFTRNFIVCVGKFG